MKRDIPQLHIKDLKDLRFIVGRGAIDIKVLQTLGPERKRRGYRSAGACPPRSPRRNEKRPQPGGHGRLLSRSMHGEGQALALQRNGDGFLLPNDHLAGSFELSRGQCVEIDPAGNRLSLFVLSVPIRGAVFF